MDNYYQIFNINRNANQTQIEEAYNSLLKRLHNNNSKVSKFFTIKLNEMYTLFSDSKKKRIYDLKLDINEAKLKFIDLYKDVKFTPELMKYYKDFKETIKDYTKYDNIQALEEILLKCNVTIGLFEKELSYIQSIANTAASTPIIASTPVATTTPIVVPDTKVNPLNWYDQYKESIINDSSLKPEQATELANYVDQLKSEFMRLFASFASIEHTKSDIDEAINNTIRLVNQKRESILAPKKEKTK